MLYILASGCIIYLIVLAVTTPYYIRGLYEAGPEEGARLVETLPPLRDLADYQEIITRHSLFGAVKQMSSAPARSACDDFKSKYILAGIVGGAENEALFNSKVGRQTSFVKAGETIEGVTVEKVGAHAVTLNCSGQQMDMAIEET